MRSREDRAGKTNDRRPGTRKHVHRRPSRCRVQRLNDSDDAVSQGSQGGLTSLQDAGTDRSLIASRNNRKQPRSSRDYALAVSKWSKLESSVR